MKKYLNIKIIMTMFESIPFSDGRDDVDNMSFVWKLSAVVIAHIIVRFIPQKLNQYPYQRWKRNSCEKIVNLKPVSIANHTRTGIIMVTLCLIYTG